MRRGTALMATMLFFSQPLLFGSAFIDQKDIPFMTCFLAVVASGLAAAEIHRPMDSRGTAQALSSPRVVVRGALDALRADWCDLGERRRKRLLIAFLVGLCIISDLLFVGLLHRLGEAVLTAAYGGHAPWPAQQLFKLVATDAYKTPVELYLDKYEQFFALLRLTATAAFFVGACGGLTLALPSIRKVWKGDWTIAQLPALLVSAGFLGCSIAIRQIGGFAGGMVSLYLLYRGRARAILPVLLYWAIALVVMYATWPYLWPDAFQRFRESFLVIGTFADHKVLFQGHRFGSAELPWNYLPTLVALELTEPAVILSSIGLLVFLRRIVTRRLGWFELGLLASWVCFPVLWVVARDVPIYNNLRHMFFVLPPLFVLGGIGLETLMERLRHVWQRGLLFILSVLPGLWGIAPLHPYEYVYLQQLRRRSRRSIWAVRAGLLVHLAQGSYGVRQSDCRSW